MNQNYKDVRATAQVQLNRRIANGQSLRTEDIRQAVESAIDFLSCDDVDVIELVAELEASFQTVIGKARSLVGPDEGYEPWLSKRKAAVKWNFWSRYERYLMQEKGWPQTTLDRLEEITDHVLGLLTAPDKPGAWDRRGMVVGHVQSGKTANYVGLICKAADAGYKLIVVLAGFHKSLRSQTQIRLEEGFLGYDRGAASPSSGQSTLNRIGVGLIDPRPRVDAITTRLDDGDFKQQVARNFAINPGGYPLLFVVKKNGSVLKNLLKWVEWAANATDENGRRFVKDVPLLIIDDEADQGSIDTRDGAFLENGDPDPEHDPTVLNQRIRQLLHLFDQSAYVGYTATPFANIFIHERAKTGNEGEDLFPRSFIVSLPTPSDYIGPAQVFGYVNEAGETVQGLPIVRHVRDHAASLTLTETQGWMPPAHKSGHIPVTDGGDELPHSLQEAIRSFVLVCAARLARGQGTAHNSMLIHVTRYTFVQNKVAEQVRTELHQLQRRIRYSDGDSPTQLREELRALWERDFEETSRQIGAQRPGSVSSVTIWEDVESCLKEAALSITVREINGQAGEVLDYVTHDGNGLNVIAVGGDKLSRGLTLEGLSVSYFLRASRMYDTLMQMGRWFGYRPGYLDLCRLYTTPDLTEWYSHIAAASEELRDDFNRMVASGGSPREFGHRVKSHPLMLVTSQVKMRHGTKIDVTFAGDITETINFWRTRNKLEANWYAAQQLVTEVVRTRGAPKRGSVRGPETASGSWYFEGVDAQPIIDFLSAYQVHDAAKKVKPKLLADYIRKEVQVARLTTWTVLVANGDSDVSRQIGGVTCELVNRSWHVTTQDEQGILEEQNHFRIRRLISPVDESRDLTADEYEAALAATLEEWRTDPEEKKEPVRPSGPQIRRTRPATRGLLMLYLLNPQDSEAPPSKNKVEPDARDIPIVGFGISFPMVDPEKASKVQYMVNNVYSRQEFGLSRTEDDELT